MFFNIDLLKLLRTNQFNEVFYQYQKSIDDFYIHYYLSLIYNLDLIIPSLTKSSPKHPI